MFNSSIERTAAHVQAAMSGEGSGHDWWHVWRVWNMAKRIVAHEAEHGADVNTFVVELAALLHDLGDHKFYGGDTTVAPLMTREWLHSLQVDAETIEQVAEIVATLSSKVANVATPMQTLEGMIVQDADRLDAIGAIGVTRAFAYGGQKG